MSNGVDHLAPGLPDVTSKFFRMNPTTSAAGPVFLGLRDQATDLSCHVVGALICLVGATITVFGLRTAAWSSLLARLILANVLLQRP
jgi:hypothetical protein